MIYKNIRENKNEKQHETVKKSKWETNRNGWLENKGWSEKMGDDFIRSAKAFKNWNE